jgi:hypothetical protein
LEEKAERDCIIGPIDALLSNYGLPFGAPRLSAHRIGTTLV